MRSRPTQAVVDLDAIASNFHLLQSRAGGRAVYAVVKADAYGHGAAAVARRLRREGADRFAVATVEEAVALRREGARGELLVLGGARGADAVVARGYGLTVAVHDLEQARALAAATASFPSALPVHLKLDTGMGRLGVRREELAKLALVVRGSAGLAVTGAFTQLASGEDAGLEPTAGQIDALREGLAALREAGVGPGTVHVANSGAMLVHPDALFDAVRPGLGLYGVLPSEEIPNPGLLPAMSLETQVLVAKDVPSGTPLGYGGRFKTSRASRIAVLPIGYHDGFRRAFSGRVAVLLRGKRAPVVGVVSMDLTLVDATEAGAAPGDRVVLMGRVGADAVTAWDLARAAGTIPWEILCGIGPRVPRVYSQAVLPN